MRDFFVNQYIESIDGTLYMRFLYRSIENLSMEIVTKTGELIGINVESSLTPNVLKVPVTSNDLYTYKITPSTSDSPIYYGYYSTTGTNFGFLSCNDNPATKIARWHKKHDGVGSWKEPLKGNYDVTIHMGDNIYGDSIWKDYLEKKIDLEEAYRRYSELFSLSYGDKYQGMYMRNGIQIHLVDDHDITDDFGYGRHVKTDKVFGDFADMVISRIFSVFVPYKSDYTHNGYMFHLMNTRMNVYNYGVKFPIRDMIRLKDKVADSHARHHFFISPQPLAFFSTKVIKAISLAVDDSIELGQHKNNVDETYMVLEYLNRINKTSKTIRVVSGDIHSARIQTYKSGLIEMVTSGITRRTPKNSKKHHRFLYWLMTKLSNIPIIDNRSLEYGGQNMGYFTPSTGFGITKM